MDNKEIYEISHELMKITKLVKRKTTTNVEYKGLSMSSHMILHLLKEETSKTLTEISDSLGLPNSTACVLVDKLVKEGLLNRVRNSDDRRKVIICLTDKALQYVEEMKDIYVKNFGELLKHASGSELDSILGGLRTLSRIMEGDDSK